MARGKHSRALFEVIKQTQEQKRRAAAAPRGGTSWFGWLKRAPGGSKPVKARYTPPIEPVMREIQHPDAATPRDETRGHDFDGRRDAPSRQVDSESQEPEQSSPIIETAPTAHESDLDVDRVFTPDENAPAYRATIEHSAENDGDDPGGDHLNEDETSSASPHDTAITTAIRDDDAPAARSQATGGGRAFNMTLSYPSLAIAAVALLMLMVVAFLAGRQASSRIALTGPTIEQLQQGKPSPEVLNLKNTPPETTLSRGAREVKPPQPKKVEPAPVETANNTQSPTPDRRRVGGRNYIIAQSYPDPDNAEKAAALLQKNNIPVTVEQLDAAPGWFCVVTEVGFDRVSGADCERYQKLVKDLNGQAKTSRLKVFEPYLYKWK